MEQEKKNGDKPNISLYQKELHKVGQDEPPRRWIVPKPNITQNQFQKLIRNRSKALERLRLKESKNTNDLETKSTNAVVQDQDVKESGMNTSDREKRIKEIQERLKVLKERKHRFVRGLKQISEAQEQIMKNISNKRNFADAFVETVETDSGSVGGSSSSPAT